MNTGNHVAPGEAELWEERWRRAKPVNLAIYRRSVTPAALIYYLKAVEGFPNRRMMEVGIGPGVMALDIAREMGFKLYGIDITLAACQKASRNGVDNNIEVNAVVGDIMNPAFR